MDGAVRLMVGAFIPVGRIFCGLARGEAETRLANEQKRWRGGEGTDKDMEVTCGGIQVKRRIGSYTNACVA